MSLEDGEGSYQKAYEDVGKGLCSLKMRLIQNMKGV